MNIPLPTPPKQGASLTQWEQWYEALWRKCVASIQTVNDVDATISVSSTYVAVIALTAARTLTLPSASNLIDGDSVVVQDESGAAGTYNITISRAGSDTINGATTVAITANYGRKTLIKRGAGKWFVA